MGRPTHSRHRLRRVPGHARQHHRPGDEITRPTDRAIILLLDPATLTPRSQLAREMGLDRGELLAGARAVLITTPAIAALLDELCAQVLAAARVARLTALALATLLSSQPPLVAQSCCTR